MGYADHQARSLSSETASRIILAGAVRRNAPSGAKRLGEGPCLFLASQLARFRYFNSSPEVIRLPYCF